MSKEHLMQVLTSILIGACVAFLSTLFDGILLMFQDYGNNIAGGTIASVYYIAKVTRVM